MKKILIALFCTAFIATAAQAQAQTTREGAMKSEHHGKNGMKHHKHHKMNKSENVHMESKKGKSANMSATPTR